MICTPRTQPNIYFVALGLLSHRKGKCCTWFFILDITGYFYPGRLPGCFYRLHRKAYCQEIRLKSRCRDVFAPYRQRPLVYICKPFSLLLLSHMWYIYHVRQKTHDMGMIFGQTAKAYPDTPGSTFPVKPP